MEKEESEILDNNTNETNDTVNQNEKLDSSQNNVTSQEEEIISLKDKITRLYADMENQRRRFEKEKDEAFEYGGFSFAKETLNLLDNLERSKSSLENDEDLKNSDALKKLIDHIDIINNDMITIFKKNNIEPIKAINEKLNPNLHQAMMEINDDNKEPGTIVQEIQKGFMMKDRLLRPSLVAVSKKGKKEDNNEKSEENQDKKDKN
ncbi:MAG: nucleotide exchange factor GrpE [Candidatus Pelagibacter sp.]|nr:nucleotide exchange factor GrpE [Candidatus Pelagibacter sp.]